MLSPIKHENTDFHLEQEKRRVDRFRRLVGLTLGLILALTYALITQVMVRLEMPEVPLLQPPLGAFGNVLIWAFTGAIIGLFVAWPEEPVYGVVISSALGTLIISILTLTTSGAPSSEEGASILMRVISLVFMFLPIAGLLAPLMIIMRWLIGRITDVYRGITPAWKVGWMPLLLIAFVAAIALKARLPADARLELERTHALIQTSLGVQDHAALPEELQAKSVGDFISQASPKYTLEWDVDQINRYGIPRSGSAINGREAVVVAHFDNEWALACLYESAITRPTCKGMGGEAGKTIFTNSAPSPFDIAWDDFSLFENGLVPDEETIPPSLAGATVYHVNVNIPENGNTITGSLQVRYTNREDTPLDEIYFRLYPNLAGGKSSVTNVQVNSRTAEVSFEQMDGALKVSLPTPLQPGENRVISLDFQVQVPDTMGGNYGVLSRQDDIWALDAFLPTIAVYDEGGWHIQPTPPNADNTFNDSSYYIVQVNAPLDMKLVTSGSLVGGQGEEKSQRAVFAAGPARDFYLAASTRFVTSSEQIGFTTVNSTSVEDVADQNAYVQHIAADAIRVFNQRYGPYPYRELDVVSLPMQALGIEYPGVIGLNIDSYRSAPGGGAISEQQDQFRTTIAHEVAHQWFYNLVGNDQQNEPWLDEALAQNAAWQFIVDLYGDGLTAQGVENYWQGCMDHTQSASVPIGLAAGDYLSGSAYVGAVYCRGPLFIFALRDAMGQAEFDEFLKDYVAQNRWGISNLPIFKAIAEKKCNCDLTPLFEAWVSKD